MNDLGAVTTVLSDVSKVLRGEQQVNVKVVIPPRDIAILLIGFFLAMLAATSLARWLVR